MTTATDVEIGQGGGLPEGDPGEIVEVELAKGLGLAEALTIGIGTMIGAGIFVLPGFIIARAGPAAILSFLLGGVIALFAAMSAAELATGMPKSGGGYYFISRALGPLWGAIIGWGSWFGLIFATAFYMVGFGEYVHTVLPVDPKVLAVGMTALLVGLNLIGSKAAGQVQNLIVAVLVAVLVLFLGRGVMDADPALITSDFAPFGAGAVAMGTATLFVTYCGFGEVASMAEEVRDPGKTLPRALVGSVVSVTVLYCVVLGICVALRPWQELQGPTVVADLAEDLMGPWGRGAILVGAVMATVSSANASIMSASRISFAMGRDHLIWAWLNQVHPRFRVPHRAILVTGALSLTVIGLGSIELLAEAAGMLHLLLYGLICVACIVLRGAHTGVYQPAYRVPAYPLTPILGAVGCFAVMFFMAPLVMAMSSGLVVFALLHYGLWGRRRTELRGAWPFWLRRAVLEPSLQRVERWGGVADEIPTAVVAVANPHREHARLELAAAVMSRGEVVAVNVFLLQEGAVTPERLEAYRRTIEERSRALCEASAPVVRAGGRVTSHVPVAVSVLFGLLSAAEASRAALVFLGWPEPGAHQQLGLLEELDRHLGSHVLVLREQGRTPARDVLLLLEAGRHADLALLVALRITRSWKARLTVISVVDEDAGAEQIAAAELALEERVGDRVRAATRVVPARAVTAVATSSAPLFDLVVIGAGDRGVMASVEALQGVEGCSVALVRADLGRPLEIGM